ncbi:MAG TPA: hypothetical protein VEB40_05390, partial [Flavipsychrobacter sp.]|nr:hypothetical protein [Flavipsychrobacter sp.]
WVQEEPRNMGALGFLSLNMEGITISKYISRPSMAASATGFSKMHAKEQASLLEQAFNPLTP